MKCILKAKEGYGARILYYKENENGLKEVYEDLEMKNKISNFEQDSIIKIDENIETIKLGENLYPYSIEFTSLKELFFS